MLDSNIKTQLKAYLEKLQQPIELVAALDSRPAAADMRQLLNDITELSDKVSLRENGSAALHPSFAIGRPGETARISFAGIRWATSSLHWSSPCCKPAATRPKSTPP